MLIVVVAFTLLSAGCATTERVINSKSISVGKIHVASSPPGLVYVNGSKIGKSPVVVPVCRLQQTLGVTKFRGELLPLWPLYVLQCSLASAMGMKWDGSEKQMREMTTLHFEEKETRTISPETIIEVSLPGHKIERLVVSPTSYPTHWRPRLVATKAYQISTGKTHFARNLFESDQYVQAAKLLDEAIAVWPENEEANRLLRQTQLKCSEQKSGADYRLSGARTLSPSGLISDRVDWSSGDKTDFFELSTSSLGLQTITVESPELEEALTASFDIDPQGVRWIAVDHMGEKSLVVAVNEHVYVRAKIQNPKWRHAARYRIKTEHAPGNDWGLFIGVSKYSDAMISSPAYCDNDAEDLSRTLQSRYGFHQSRIRVLLNEQASKSQIYSTVRAMAKRIKPEDRLLFFFSGHGGGGATGGNNYLEFLLPYDAVKRSGSLKSWSDSCVSPEFFSELFEDLKCHTVVLVFDCCFSAGGGRAVAKRTVRGQRLGELSYRGKIGGQFVKGIKVLAEQVRPHHGDRRLAKNILILCASQADQPAWGDDISRHGLFTGAILEILEKSNKPISWEAVFDAAKKHISKKRQIPKGIDLFPNEDIYLYPIK
jgi:hypothetical protein